MTANRRHKRWAPALLLAAAVTAQGQQMPAGSSDATAQSASASQPSQRAFAPLTVKHRLGTTAIERAPQRAVALDMNEVDFLDQLGVPVVGMPKDFIPHFLAKYRDAPGVQDLGAIVQPNLERVHAAKPDLILMTSLQANHYKALAEIAPTIHFDVDYRNSQVRHIEAVKYHLATLGRIFGKEDLARRKADELDARIAEVRRTTQSRPERALIVLHNNGAFSAFGVQSRHGFVFNALGVKPALPAVETGLHGQPISSEFIQQTDPDILYVVDRTAVMERRPVMDAERMSNPLLRQTRAWKNGRVVFVDADAWYITAASVTSLKIVIDDVLKGYRS